MCVFDDMPRSQIEFLINEWIHDQRDREIVRRRLLDGLTYERLAEEFDLSVRHTKTIVYKAEDRLRTKVTP